MDLYKHSAQVYANHQSCIAISWSTLFLILLTSLVVAVPVSQLSVSPKMVHLLKGDMPSKVGSLLRG